MKRRYWQDGVEIVREDFNSIAKATERSIYDAVMYELLQRTEDSFFGDSFLVSFSSSTSVSVLKGLGFQTDSAQVNPEPTRRPIFMEANETLNIMAPDASLDRIDLVVVKAALEDDITATRKYKAPISLVVSNESVVIQQKWLADLVVVEGTPNASPVAPAIPAGYIKIAELYVNAVIGMTGAGDVTDFRTLMPIAGDIFLNTTGYQRITAGAATALSQIILDIETFLQNGRQGNTDYIEQVSDPAAPSAGRVRMYHKSGVWYYRQSGGAVLPFGTGGGGGGGLQWYAPDGFAPLEEEEFLGKVFKFATGAGQKLVVYMKVPETYLAGAQILMRLGQYTTSASNTQLLSATTELIRQNNDAVDAPISSYSSTNTALTNTVAKQYRKASLDLTNGSGAVGGFAVQPGDMLKVSLQRGSDTDTDDIRFIPTSTEVKFT